MLTTISDIIRGILAAIPILNKWFSKPLEEKRDEVKKDVRADLEESRKTGRPKW